MGPGEGLTTEKRRLHQPSLPPGLANVAAGRGQPAGVLLPSWGGDSTHGLPEGGACASGLMHGIHTHYLESFCMGHGPSSLKFTVTLGSSPEKESSIDYYYESSQ